MFQPGVRDGMDMDVFVILVPMKSEAGLIIVVHGLI
jgi:hypothetical protein